jgi:hypothetical protein
MWTPPLRGPYSEGALYARLYGQRDGFKLKDISRASKFPQTKAGEDNVSYEVHMKKYQVLPYLVIQYFVRVRGK